MNSPPWDRSEAARHSAEIDAEVEEIFEELEMALGKPAVPGAAADGPGPPGRPDDVVLPDDFELPAGAPADPAPPAPILPDDFELSAAAIAPAADHDPLAGPGPGESAPLELELESGFGADPGPWAGAAPGPRPGAPLTVAELSPRELADLIERAVERAFRAALRDRGN
ncbi:MAG: hypothetical protein LBP33_12110 [Candidatus Adiutrix sp.]|jgi:hypothetical protein|nr:hypothetical protein [Candidatus Adiutrix sp.]